MTKRISSMLLALVLCLALAAPARAEEYREVGKNIVISCNGLGMAAIDPDGNLWTWGDNRDGQLGLGTRDDRSHPTPTKVMDHVVSVCSGDTTAAIRTDGSLWMWGDNYYGQLGDGTTNDRYIPAKVMDDVLAVSCAGAGHTAVVKTDGSLWMCGRNCDGQLGDGTYEDRHTFFKVMDDVATVNCGTFTTAAIKTDGSLWMWGYKGSGHSSRKTPAKVMDDVVGVTCGRDYTVAIKSDGSLWVFGIFKTPLDGEVHYDYDTPAKVMDGVKSFISGSGLVHVWQGSAGTYYAVLKTDGSLWMWGDTSEEGDPYFKVLDNVEAISGYFGVAAVKTDGSLWTWGSNAHGELGYPDGDFISSTGNSFWDTYYQYKPRQVPNMTIALPAATPAIPELSVTVNGAAVQWTDAKPFIDANSRTMVPLRAVGDALGLTVGWDAAAREASFSDGAKTVYFPIDSATARTSDGQTIAMDTAAVIVNDRTYAPVRYLAEFFGHTVSWDGATRTVGIQ